jgi:DNA-binding FrmR family transcriptional regulator
MLGCIPPRGILEGMKHGYSADKDKLAARLSRVEGQVRGISRMVAEDRYCIDILTQVNAAKAALDQVALLLLEDHVKGCVVTAVREGETDKVDELIDAVARFAGA